MRFIIPELPYEQPVARGVWRYERDGIPTGAIEQWRLSAAHEGYQFLRVDLDARSAPSGRSYLFHAVLDEDNQPVRLKFRLWQAASEIMGNVHLEGDAVLYTSGQGEDRSRLAVARRQGGDDRGWCKRRPGIGHGHGGYRHGWGGNGRGPGNGRYRFNV